MAYITEGYLNAFYNQIGPEKAHELKTKSFKIEEIRGKEKYKTIFLSHSHKDKDIVEKAAVYLLSQGIFVYVDWKDSSMPEVTSSETASKIKNRIIICDEFIVLASNNALDSKWVPWELGFADSAKGMSKVSIFPIADNAGHWKGSEYFSLYQKIELGRKENETIPYRAVVRAPENTYVASAFSTKIGLDNDSTIYYVR